MPSEKSAEAMAGRIVTEGSNLKTGNRFLVLDEKRRARKKIETSEADLRVPGRKPAVAQASGANFPGNEEASESTQPSLIERMLQRGNLLKALQAVEATHWPLQETGLISLLEEVQWLTVLPEQRSF